MFGKFGILIDQSIPSSLQTSYPYHQTYLSPYLLAYPSPLVLGSIPQSVHFGEVPLSTSTHSSGIRTPPPQQRATFATTVLRPWIQSEEVPLELGKYAVYT